MQSYRFSNLLGATYKGGTCLFSPDGNLLLSPVGNRVSVVDLVQGYCTTLAPENRRDTSILVLSPDGKLLLSIDSVGHGILINFVRGCVLGRISFKGQVKAAKWSPDNKWLAVTHGRRVQIWRAPSLELGWQFVHHRNLGGHTDDLVDVSWASNSLFLCTCSADMTVRLLSIDPMEGFSPVVLAEHRSHVRAAFFSGDLKHLYSISRDGVLVSLCFTEGDEHAEEALAGTAKRAEIPLYCRPGKWTMETKAYCQQPPGQKVTRSAFDEPSNILAVGFSGGIFMLFEMPGLQALQTLSLGSDPLDSVSLGANGDWLAVGSSNTGQLLVWEWRSETYILKQQGHHWGVQCVAFSPSSASSLKRQKTLATASGATDTDRSGVSGRLVATGGYDGKVKVFNSQTGLCFVTFAEHTAAVSGLCFTPQGNAILSASKDGSVRAFDLLRYRNFRTFVSPDKLCQFNGVSVDSGGEIVAASSFDEEYTIYVWSIQTGSVLEVLTGHTSHVQTLQFSPSASNPGQLVSGSWDGTLCVWDLYTSESKGGEPEKLRCASSVLCAAFDPRANDTIAAACMTGQVQFWNVSNATHLGSIEGLRDIESGRHWKDRFTSLNKRGVKAGLGLGKGLPSDGVNANRHFNSISYARNGELLLCSAQNSPHVYLYDTSSYTLAARTTLTTNMSLSGVQSILNSKNMTEAGVSINMFDLSDSEADDVDVAKSTARTKQANSLPGVNVGETKDRYAERQLHVWNVVFSADSAQFAAATTHGVFVYSADGGSTSPGASYRAGGSSSFVPQMLTKKVSGPAILEALKCGEIPKAMILALALNDVGLIRQVYESVPVKSISVVVASIGSPLLPALLWFLCQEFKPSAGTPHFQFHVHWIAAIMDVHFMTLMELSTGKSTARTGAAIEAAAASRSDVAALCLQLLVELSQRHVAMVRTFDGNINLLRYLSSGSKQDAKLELTNTKTEPAQNDEGEPTNTTSALVQHDDGENINENCNADEGPKKKLKRRISKKKEINQDENTADNMSAVDESPSLKRGKKKRKNSL